MALALLGCRAPANPPLAPRPLLGPHATSMARWSGGVLSGPQAAVEPTDANEETPAAWRLRVTLFALARPLTGGTPLARRSALGANVQGAVALSVENPLLLRGRVATGGDAVAWRRRVEAVESLMPFESGAPGAAAARDGAGNAPTVRTARIFDEVVVVPAGSTMAFSIGAVDVERPPDDFLTELSLRGPFPQRVDLLVGATRGDAATAAGVQVAVAVQDRDRTDRDAEAEPPRRSAAGFEAAVRPSQLRRDIALLDARPVPGGTPLGIQVPSPLDAGAAQCMLAFVECLGPVGVGPASPDNNAASLADAYAALAAADAAYAALDATPDVARLAEQRALDALATGDGRRTALLVLADTRDAPLVAELALTLDDDALASYAERVRAAGLAPSPGLGWDLEREALRFASARLADDTATPALRSVLLRRAGQAGRFPGVLEEVATASASLGAADARLVDENTTYLEDSDPSARLRAMHWLAQRGLTPAGFDPLGTADERRAALRAARGAGATPGQDGP